MSTRLLFAGRLRDLPIGVRRTLLERAKGPDDATTHTVRSVIADVRARGDAALFDLARRFDGVSLESLEVPRTAITAACDRVPPDVRRVLERARDNIAAVHTGFAPSCVEVEPEPGVVVGRRPDPLGRVGVYAPGGRAVYPSSVLMGAVPARAVGVGEVVLCSPPDSSGAPHDAVLAAAKIAGVDRVFAVGGAGAIAAMAIGTETIPRVDKVVGPGNAFVSAAKLQLVGEIGIDSPAGPSELLVIADRSARARDVAIELVAQAEHDPEAAVVAVVIGDHPAAEITAALDSAVSSAQRRGIVEQSLSAHGALLVVDDLTQALEFAAAYAPEHLWLAVRDAELALPSTRNAGTVFVGCDSSVAFGDYMTGANHVLPTAGSARVYSGLSPLDFVRWTTYQRVTPEAARLLAPDVALFAEAESLPGHAAAARRWSVVR